MPLVQVPKNIQPRQIEFGEDVDRSKPGALYFVPGTTKRITKGELEWIQKNHKRFSQLLSVIQMEDKPSRLVLERAAKAKKAPAKKRPKDRMSKAKQRAKALVEGKGKGNPAPVPAMSPPPPEPEPESRSGKKKK